MASFALMFLPLETQYRGQRRPQDGRAIVLVTRGRSFERLLTPGPSQVVLEYCRGDFFEWGYGGAGPAQLALAILLDFLRDRELAVSYSEAFKWAYVAEWHEPRWQISGAEIVAWLHREGAAISADQIPGDRHGR